MAEDSGAAGLGAGWAAASQAVEQEVAAWRRAHPRASLTEIEQAVERATQCLGQWLVATLAEEADGAQAPVRA